MSRIHRNLSLACLLWVKSDGSKNLTADITAAQTTIHSEKSPASGMAEEQALAASAVTVSKVS